MTEFLQSSPTDLPWYGERDEVLECVPLEEDPFYVNTLAAIETLLAAFPEAK
jgi:hypothetical protein